MPGTSYHSSTPSILVVLTASNNSTANSKAAVSVVVISSAVISSCAAVNKRGFTYSASNEHKQQRAGDLICFTDATVIVLCYVVQHTQHCH